MRKPLIAGNWKMYKNATEGAKLARSLKRSLRDVKDREIVIAPPFATLPAVSRAIAGGNIGLAAQNMHHQDEGAFTGEVSADMLLSVGVGYVIIGHSERRQYFGETNKGCLEKITKALGSGLVPIYCIGETLGERKRGRTFAVVEKQIREGLAGLSRTDAKGVVIAYEPIWAIGTGKTATPQIAQEVHARIRGIIKELFGAGVARAVRILYGGSVKPGNVDTLMAEKDIDGALVGGASLDAKSFSRIVKYVS